MAESQLVALRTEIQDGLDAAQRDKALLDRLVDIRSAESDDGDGSITDHDYEEAFRGRRNRSGRPVARRGGSEDQGPPGVGDAGRGQRLWTTGR